MQRLAELTSPDNKNRYSFLSQTLCPAVEKMAGFVEGKDDKHPELEKIGNKPQKGLGL
jgi:hypothetical protein